MAFRSPADAALPRALVAISVRVIPWVSLIASYAAPAGQGHYNMNA